MLLDAKERFEASKITTISGSGGNYDGVVDWSLYDWVTDNANEANRNKYKFAPLDGEGTVVGILQDSGGRIAIYAYFNSAVIEASMNSSFYKTEGAGIFIYLDSITQKETVFAVTTGYGLSRTCAIYYEEGVE